MVPPPKDNRSMKRPRFADSVNSPQIEESGYLKRPRIFFEGSKFETGSCSATWDKNMGLKVDKLKRSRVADSVNSSQKEEGVNSSQKEEGGSLKRPRILFEGSKFETGSCSVSWDKNMGLKVDKLKRHRVADSMNSSQKEESGSLKRPRILFDGSKLKTGSCSENASRDKNMGSKVGTVKKADRKILFKGSTFEIGSCYNTAGGKRVDAAEEFERKARMRVMKAMNQFQEELEFLSDYTFNHLKGNDRYIAAANRMRKESRWVNMNRDLGNIPGVYVGDKFRYRAEMCVVNLHGQFEFGIDCFTNSEGKLMAKCIVDSGRYGNQRQSDDILIYVGEGRHQASKRAPDQKRRNRALMNCFPASPVRVIMRYKIGRDTGFVYVGLYTVDDYWLERVKGEVFLLTRIPGQPKLTIRNLGMPR